jgi:Peptidase family M1 domain
MRSSVGILSQAIVIAVFLVSCCDFDSSVFGQSITNSKFSQEDKFRQMDEVWPTPNGFRSAAGEPGHEYWQQRADYVIDIKLDDATQRLTGSEKITYHNRSPHTLRYLWMHLDGNIFDPESDYNKLRPPFVPQGRLSLDSIKRMKTREAFDGGFKITHVADGQGKSLDYTIVKTVMRIDLHEPLLPGEDFKFMIDWNYQINNSAVASMRTGCEFFEKDGNFIYEVAQWFPRMAAFTDAKGWQHRQYIGQGEFTLELGDYMVRITVPEDHVVAATGVLQNPEDVLTELQRERLKVANSAKTPVFIVTPEEAIEAEKQKKTGTKTWAFHAQNVRDFAWASSRKFIWDAQGHDVEGNNVLAMSFYPNEGEPLWSKYSTHAIIHTLNVYSRYTFAYPYPVAISVNGPVGGMEYPMICFNGPRPQKDGTYSDRTKYGLITVVIHEVGHNYFPMIVNSDEREWTWMDEGLNTFLQYLAEQEWEQNYPSQRGEPSKITDYMRSGNQVPIMTNSESVLQFGNNAYGKPATALNILRETILGRELFDFAFKEYARRWKFKRPMPADFFRTMEDASGVDLDWFWQGWFYTTDHCDIAIDKVAWHTATDGDPDEEAGRRKSVKDAQMPTLSESRNKDLPKRADEFPELKDFYNSYDPSAVTPEIREEYRKALEKLSPEEREAIEQSMHYYQLSFKNVGGLVMPIILRLNYEDGTHKVIRLPVDIWTKDNKDASTTVISTQPITSIELDPHRETADTNRDNNYFPARFEPTRFQIYKQQQGRPGEVRGGPQRAPRGPERAPQAQPTPSEGDQEPGDNPMRAARRKEEAARAKREAEEKKKNEEAAKKEEPKGEEPKPASDSPAKEPAAEEKKPEEKKAEEKKEEGKQ